MLSDYEIRSKGMKILIEGLGLVEAEKFVSLIIKDPFDYTEWQRGLMSSESIKKVSEKAMDYRKKSEE